MGGLGMPEIIVIMVIALIVFGPRKLPELGKSLGKAMNQFKRASEDFKRTWEQEVDLETVRKTPTSLAPAATDYSSSYDSTGGANPYDFDNQYGYNTPVDETSPTETGSDAAETHASAPQVQDKPQPGQWI